MSVTQAVEQTQGDDPAPHPHPTKVLLTSHAERGLTGSQHPTPPTSLTENVLDPFSGSIKLSEYHAPLGDI